MPCLFLAFVLGAWDVQASRNVRHPWIRRPVLNNKVMRENEAKVTHERKPSVSVVAPRAQNFVAFMSTADNARDKTLTTQQSWKELLATGTEELRKPWSNELPGSSPTPGILACVALVACAAFTVYAASGFGPNMLFQWGWFVFSLYGVFSGNMGDAAAIMSVFMFPLDVVQCVLLRHYLNVTLACVLGISAALAEPLGVWLLVRNDTPHLKVGFGVTLLMLFAWRLYLEVREQSATSAEADAKPDAKPKPFAVWSQPVLVIGCGALSGFLGGIFASPGPGLMLFALISKVDKDEMRSSIQVFGLFVIPARFFSLWAFRSAHGGDYGPEMPGFVPICAAAFAGGLMGLLIGNHLTHYLTPLGWRLTMLCVMLMCSATFLAAPVLTP